MNKIPTKIREELKDLGLDENSKFSDFADFLDQVNFIIESEKELQTSIWDSEVEFFSKIDIKIYQFFDFLVFIKSGATTPELERIVRENIGELSRIRPEYDQLIQGIRDQKLKGLLGED